MDDIEDSISPEDARAIGYKIAEAAERVRSVDKILPGAQAEWWFEADDVRFEVVITVARNG